MHFWRAFSFLKDESEVTGCGLRALYCSLRLLKSTKQWPAKSLFYSKEKQGHEMRV